MYKEGTFGETEEISGCLGLGTEKGISGKMGTVEFLRLWKCYKITMGFVYGSTIP